MSASKMKPARVGSGTGRLLTTAEIADELGTTLHRVAHAILRHRLAPDLVAARLRLDRLDEFASTFGTGAEPVAD